MADRQALEQAIAAVMAGQPAVVAAFLAGSVAQGRATPLSDVDVAVWLDPGASRAERWQVRLALLHELALALGRDDVDLTILNDAEPAVRYQLLRDGRRVACRDAALAESLQVWATKQYFDFLPILRLHQAALRQRIAEGRFAKGG